LIFIRDIVSLKPTIVLIISHFLTSVKFRKLSWQYQNSAEKANSVAWLEIPRFAENYGP